MSGPVPEKRLSLEEKRETLKRLLMMQANAAPDRSSFPLSFAQRRLWFLYRLYPDSTAYAVPWLKRLRGPLDRDALERALTAIVARHETLRTTFRDTPEGPEQTIHPPFEVRLAPEAVPGNTAREQELNLIARCEAHFSRRFDLEAGPVFEAALFQINAEDHALLIRMHHIITDGWSIGLLMNELRTFYNAFRAGAAAALPPLPIQYADFALWQKEHLEGAALESQRRYWRERLAKLPPLALRTDYPRPGTVRFEGEVVFIEVEQTLYARAKLAAAQENVTLFVLMLSAFQALLRLYTRQEDIAIGTPIANRNRQETEGLIGFFVNTLVMRTDLSGNPSFRELLRRTRQTAFEAYDHQDLPFESIVEELAPERDPSRHPLFQVAFAVQNTPAAAFTLDGLVAEDIPGAVAKSVRMDLELHLTEGENGRAAFAANYNPHLFSGHTIERLLQRFFVLLEGALSAPETPIAALPILLPGERDTLLSWARGPETAFPKDKLIHEYVADHARRRPDAPAIVHGQRVWNYAQLDGYANQLAVRLRRAGLRAGGLAGVYLRRSPEMLLAQLAVLKAGGAYAALDPDAPPQRIAEMLDDIQAAIVLTQPELQEPMAGGGREAVIVTPASYEPPLEQPPCFGAKNEDRPAYVIFTSGSTGRPKGTLVTHPSLVNMCCWFTRRFAVTEADRIASVFAPAFDGLAFEVWPCFMGGAAIHLPDEETRISADKLRQWLVANRIAVCTAPTVLADALLALPWPETAALRYLIAGGDRLHRRPAANAPFKMINAYGPTENTVVATIYEVPPDDRHAAPPIGKPIDNTQAYILDACGRPAPEGITGELYLGGAQVAREYVNRAELTAASFLENPFDPGKMYRTGDLARFDPEGNIEFVGRADGQVQLYGLRIELGEIEHALCRHASVQQAVVIVREDVPGQKRLVAYLTGEGRGSGAELARFLRERLPGYMIPASLQWLEAMPLTPNGKIDLEALPAPVMARRGAGLTMPRNVTEERLLGLWRKLLNASEIGVEDNFFELGGNSLLILQAVTEIREAFDVDPPLQGLFETPTIAAWGALIEDMQRGIFSQAVLTPIIPLRRHGSRPPLFCVAAVGGTVLTYYALTHFLGDDQPVYGLQDPSYATGSEPIGAIGELADLYAKVLRDAQPQGPYRLFGWSFGAIVACEIARRLVAAGEQVDALFLLDPPPVSFMEGERIERAGRGGMVVMFLRALHMFFMHGLAGVNLMRDGYYVQFATYWHNVRKRRTAGKWWTRPYDGMLYVLYRLFLRNSQIAQFLENESRFVLIQQPYTGGFLRIFRANIRAISKYRPEPCPVKGIIIFSDDERMVKEQQETEILWRRMCQAGLDVERTSGNHLSTVRLPHVRTLAEILRKHIK